MIRAYAKCSGDYKQVDMIKNNEGYIFYRVLKEGFFKPRAEGYKGTSPLDKECLGLNLGQKVSILRNL